MQTLYFVEKGIKMTITTALSAVVTCTLLLIMCALIATESPELEKTVRKITEVVMDKNTEIEIQTDPVIEKPIDPLPQPPMPEITETFENTNELLIAIEPPISTVVKSMKSQLISTVSIATVKIAPMYPRRAQAKGVEGFVDLMFDITATGKVANIRILYAEPKGYFERESIKTLAKWKFEPLVIDGVVQTQKDQRTRMSFELEKG